jgi:hypothetical protein
MQRFLVPLFTFIWWSRLRSNKIPHDVNHWVPHWITHIVKVKGWRTALVDRGGQRLTIQFMFDFEKIEK